MGHDGSMVRIAVAQGLGTQKFDAASIAQQGRETRELMRTAAAGSARLLVFTEGSLSGYPQQRLISSEPEQVAEADWSLLAWDALAHELRLTAELAGGAPTMDRRRGSSPLTRWRETFNSLHVISDAGIVVDRYDKRYLSTTENSFLYAAGTHPTMFEVDGLRFGCALCIEAGLPEVFTEYESMNADCVLLGQLQHHAGLLGRAAATRSRLAHADVDRVLRARSRTGSSSLWGCRPRWSVDSSWRGQRCRPDRLR